MNIDLSFKDGRKVDVAYPIELLDDAGNIVYKEYRNGNWSKYEFDIHGNRTYVESSDGYWAKYEYDAYRNQTYNENSSGYKRGKSMYALELHIQTLNFNWLHKQAKTVELSIADIEKIVGHPVKVIK